MKKQDNTTMIPPTPLPGSDQESASKKPRRSAAQPKEVKKTTKPRSTKKEEKTKPVEAKTELASMVEAPNEALEEIWVENESNEVGELQPEETVEETEKSTKKHSLFNRITPPPSPSNEKLPSMEMICKKSGLTENDIYMMFELGYENELGRLVGYENLKRLKSDLQKLANQQETHRYITSFGYRGRNFVSNSARETIVKDYVSDRKFALVRLLVATVCTLLLFFMDQPNFLTGTALGSFAAQNTRLWDTMALLLLIPPILLSARPLYAGLRSFFVFSPTPYSFTAILTPIAFLYSIAVIILQGEMLRVNFLLSCVLFTVALCDVFRLFCELRTFRMLSSDDDKYVLTEATPSKKKLRYNNKIVKIMNDDLGKSIYEVHKTKQTVGFFRRFNAMDAAARPFTALITLMLSLAILFAFVATVYTDNLASALSLAITTLMVSMPLSFFFAFFYPLCRANRILARRGCAVIGEESVEELENEKTVVFRDTLLFDAEKSAEIAVRKNDDFQQDLLLAGALFRKLGGTMKKIGVTLASPEEEPQITIVRIHEFGIEAMANSRTHLLAGSAEFLRYSGVRVPRENPERALARESNVSVMYFAVDGVLKLSYEIEYKTNASFEKLIEDLAEGEVAVALSTYDPNLNEVFLRQSRDRDKEAVIIRKPGRFEESKDPDKADTSVIARNEETDIVYPLYAVSGISTLRRFALRMQVIASVLGALGVLLLMIFKPESPLGIPSILAYQALWLSIFTLSAHAELSESRFRFRR